MKDKRHIFSVFLVAFILCGWIWELNGISEAKETNLNEPIAAQKATNVEDSQLNEQLKKGDWWAQVQKNIREQEYHVTYQKNTSLPDLTDAYQAPNRAQNLRTYFTSKGIEIVRRTEINPTWRASMKLEGVRRGIIFEDLPKDTSPEVTGSRIEYKRGPLIEWYVNKPDGLEQGFTINERFKGDGNLELIFSIQGNLRTEMSVDNQAVDFFTSSNVRVLRYSDLHVFDATRRKLPSHLELAGKKLHIIISDQNASFPIIVDPLLTSPSWTSESNQASAHFGYSVGTAGDVNGDGYSDVIVGAPEFDSGQTNEGRAYVYYGDISGLLTTGYWTSESNIQYAYFGRSVSTAGDVDGDGYSDVIIGMPFNDNNSASNEERAFVYHGSATGLSTTPDWTGQSGINGDWYGGAVSTAGDVNGDGFSDVIVGARLYGGQMFDDNGSAFVYHGSAGGLNTNPAWNLFYSLTGSEFGRSVSFAGDVNGDGYDDVIISTWSSAFAFHGSSTGLNASSNWSVSIGGAVGGAGDVNGDGFSDVIVGDSRYSSNTGIIRVYHGSASGLSSTDSMNRVGEQGGARFGDSVGSAGDINGDGYADIIVGSYEINKAYVFRGNYFGLSTTPIWEQSSQANSDFGHSVGTAGDVDGDGYSDIIVGARYYDSGQTDEGRAFVYRGTPDGLAEGWNWGAAIYSTSAQFGYAVSDAGDVNGDGYDDVIVGANGYDNGSTDEGAAFVYNGSSTGLNTSAAWMFESNQSTAFLGESVGTAGDVNGDGYSDVIIGAPYYTYGQTDEGKVFVCYGSSGGLGPDGNPTTADWTAEGNQFSAWFGISTGSAGDVNGDSYGDIIIGATGYDDGQTNEGKVFVYNGSSTGLGSLGTPLNADWTVQSNQADAQLGSSVDTAGDVNGDGYSDIILGAQFYDNGQNNEGRAFVYHGSSLGLGASGTPGNADWTAESDQASAEYGCSVSTAGDIDGDGYSDVIVGAFRYHYFDWMEGAAFVYHGSAEGLSATADWDDGTEMVNSRFGFSVSDAGDVNGDGYGDVIIGATQFGSGQIYEGTTFVYYGSSFGLSASASATYEGGQDNAYSGCSVSSAGDVNGDGFSDILVGAYGYDASSYIDTGAAFVCYGSMNRGKPVSPRQLRADGVTPISAMGMSDSESSFIISAAGYTPIGRQDVQLEYEVKPKGTLFNGSGTIVSGWHDSGTGGFVFSESVNDLIGHTAYNWRMRLRYEPGNAMGLVAGRWFSPFPGQLELIDFHTSNAPPIGGYTSDNSIPAVQVSQSTDGNGIITIQFRVKDAGRNLCTLQDFSFYPDGSWHPLSSASGSLGGGWPDNEGAQYISEPDWTGPVYFLTLDTKHSDVASHFLNADYPNIRIRFRINDGLDTGVYVYTESFRVDNLAPTTGNITINDNADSGYTNDSTPPLSLLSSGANEMRFALSEGGAWTGWYPYSTSFSSFNISTGGNGPKTVLVEFIDEFGNVQTAHAFDSTIYDTVAPTDGTLSIDGGLAYTNSVSVILSLSAFDTYGVSEMRFSNDGMTYSDPEAYSTVKAWALEPAEGTRTVYARFRDQAGNWSSPVADTIILDSLGPVTGSIIIEGDAAFVDLENVTLNLSATDSSGISSMRFSNDGDTYDAPRSYATSTSWDLLSDDGNKTVYAQFEDQAGNWSLVFSDSVYLDMTPPVSQISSPEYASGDSITLTWSVGDGDGSGVQETTFLSKRLAGANWNRELLTVPPGEFEFSDFSGDGDYYFALVSTDNLGNVEPDPVDVNDSRVTHTIYDSGNPCSEATDLSFDESSGAYTITYIYDDIYAGESPCQGASSGSGVVQVALHVVKPDTSEEVITVSGGDLANPIEYTPPEGEEGLYGFYTIATDTAGNVEDAPASGVDLETIYSVDFPGYAILAVGSIASDPVGLLSHTKTANNVYAHLINRNFALVDSVEKWHDPYDQIRYYNPYSVGQLGEDDIGFSYMGTMLDTVTNWAMDKMRLRPGPLYIILINHGSDDRFYLEPPAFFTAQNLSDWLDALEGGMAAEGIAPQKIVVVIGTCQSGSFMGDLAKENRIIVASSAGNEPSYRGPMEPGGVRDGEFFTTSFFNALGQGYDLKTSYQRAVERVEIHTDSGEINSPEPYFDSARQHPRLEDDGLAPFGSHTPIVGGDGDAAAEIYLGAKKGDFEPLLITSIDKPEAPLSSGEFMASFSIKISDATRHDIAWMEVRSPDLILDESSDPSQQEIVDLVEAPMAWNESSQQFEGDFFDFFLEGRYSVFFYIRDIDSGIVSPPAMTYVYKEKSSSANNPPGSFSLLMPEEGTGWHTTFEGFGAAWEQSVDPDGDAVTYTIEIRHDDTDSRWDTDTFFYKREGILKNNVVVGPEADYVDLRYYKWQIVAVDQYGESTFSNEEWQFEIDDTDPFPGFLDIFVFDASTNQGIASANLLSDGGHNIVSTGDGYYFGTGSAGSFSLDVQASGYYSVSDLPLNVLEGSIVVLTVSMNPMEPEKFGDVDGIPPVNLTDAVLSLQIISGLSPTGVDLGADVNGDGKIGMEEMLYILQSIAELR